MKLNIRNAESSDAPVLGRICYEAFYKISDEHNFPADFPTPEVGIGLISSLIERNDVYSVVAELEGKIVGSNFLWKGNSVAGVGPITIDPGVQNRSVGRSLMDEVLLHAQMRGFLSVRLVQAAYHNRSLSLYSKLGFKVDEPLSTIQGTAINKTIDGYHVREMTDDDVEDCDQLCSRVHGHTRIRDIRDAVDQKTGTVVESDNRITGYSTTVGYFGHTVGESNNDIKALIGAAREFPGPGFLLPTRNFEVLSWCLENGLRIVQPLNLMSRGFYQVPRGAFMPSILF